MRYEPIGIGRPYKVVVRIVIEITDVKHLECSPVTPHTTWDQLDVMVVDPCIIPVTVCGASKN